VVASGRGGATLGKRRQPKVEEGACGPFLSCLLGFALHVTRMKYSVDGATFIQKRIGMI
jgi:hypothetical protein